MYERARERSRVKSTSRVGPAWISWIELERRGTRREGEREYMQARTQRDSATGYNVWGRRDMRDAQDTGGSQAESEWGRKSGLSNLEQRSDGTSGVQIRDTLLHAAGVCVCVCVKHFAASYHSHRHTISPLPRPTSHPASRVDVPHC